MLRFLIEEPGFKRVDGYTYGYDFEVEIQRCYRVSN